MASRPPPSSCIEFGALLRETFARVNLTDPALIGQLVAHAQTYPDRDHLPYHPAVVRAWFDGSCVPDGDTFEAIESVLVDIMSPLLEHAYENATLNAPPANELSVVLSHRMHKKDVYYSQFAQELHAQGVRSSKGEPLSGGAISYWRSGTNKIPDDAISAFDQILPEPDSPVTFSAIRQVNTPCPSHALQLASISDHLSDSLYYIRHALQLSGDQMVGAINRELAPGKSISRTGLSFLENSRPERTYGREVFSGTDLVSVYGAILTQHGHGAWYEQNEQRLRSSHERTIREEGLENPNFTERATRFLHQPVTRIP